MRSIFHELYSLLHSPWCLYLTKLINIFVKKVKSRNLPLHEDPPFFGVGLLQFLVLHEQLSTLLDSCRLSSECWVHANHSDQELHPKREFRKTMMDFKLMR